MSQQVLDFLKDLDWKTLIAALSLLVSVVSVRIAIRESRQKARQAEERAKDALKYREFLESLIHAGRFAEHLKGMDERLGNVATQLERVASKSAEVVEIASAQVSKSLNHLRKVAAASEEIASQMRNVGRNVVKAHQSFVAEAVRGPVEHVDKTKEAKREDDGD